jgi:uncharacterized protein (TIGR03663 family)
MDSARQADPEREWRLESVPDQAHPVQPAHLASSFDFSRGRLERPVHVVTVEHLAWSAIVLWAVISRFAALGSRPLTSDEAGNALYAYDLANRTSEAAASGFQPVWSGWVHLANTGIFALIGSSDFAARILFALFGLLLVVMAFELRDYVGRAGAIAVGAMLTLSPTITWFSRSDNSPICAAALALVTIALFMALKARPSTGRAVALGISAGAMLSADETGVVTATIFVAALALLGVFELLTTRNAYLRGRVWLTRYSGLVISVILMVIAVALASQLVIGLSINALISAISDLKSLRWTNWRAGVGTFALPLGFYDFQIVIASIIGIMVVGAARVRTRFAFFVLLWTLMSYAFGLLALPRAPKHLLVILVPAALLGGVGLDYLHHSRAWNKLRWVVVAFVAFTFHAQALTNFDNDAPDPTEAPWARRANLFWNNGATTPQAVARCAALLHDVPPGNATVFNNSDKDWPAALRWYLRGLRPVTNQDGAAIVVDTNGFNSDDDRVRASHVDFEEIWRPDPSELTAERALLYFFTQRAWGELAVRSVLIEPGPQTGGASPTIILPPNRP